jgi:hypothetical protein
VDGLLVCNGSAKNHEELNRWRSLSFALTVLGDGR